MCERADDGKLESGEIASVEGGWQARIETMRALEDESVQKDGTFMPSKPDRSARLACELSPRTLGLTVAPAVPRSHDV